MVKDTWRQDSTLTPMIGTSCQCTIMHGPVQFSHLLLMEVVTGSLKIAPKLKHQHPWPKYQTLLIEKWALGSTHSPRVLMSFQFRTINGPVQIFLIRAMEVATGLLLKRSRVQILLREAWKEKYIVSIRVWMSFQLSITHGLVQIFHTRPMEVATNTLRLVLNQERTRTLLTKKLDQMCM